MNACNFCRLSYHGNYISFESNLWKGICGRCIDGNFSHGGGAYLDSFISLSALISGYFFAGDLLENVDWHDVTLLTGLDVIYVGDVIEWRRLCLCRFDIWM